MIDLMPDLISVHRDRKLIYLNVAQPAVARPRARRGALESTAS